MYGWFCSFLSVILYLQGGSIGGFIVKLLYGGIISATERRNPRECGEGERRGGGGDQRHENCQELRLWEIRVQEIPCLSGCHSQYRRQKSHSPRRLHVDQWGQCSQWKFSFCMRTASAMTTTTKYRTVHKYLMWCCMVHGTYEKFAKKRSWNRFSCSKWASWWQFSGMEAIWCWRGRYVRLVFEILILLLSLILFLQKSRLHFRRTPDCWSHSCFTNFNWVKILGFVFLKLNYFWCRILKKQHALLYPKYCTLVREHQCLYDRDSSDLFSLIRKTETKMSSQKMQNFTGTGRSLEWLNAICGSFEKSLRIHRPRSPD